jgi:hypothetical protein
MMYAMIHIEGDQVGAGDTEFDKGFESDKVVCSEDTNKMTIAEEASTTLWSLEFGNEVVWVDGKGVPEERVKGGGEALVDQAAEGQVVLREVVGYEM